MAVRYHTFFFSTEGRHLSPLNFRWVDFSVLLFFLLKKKKFFFFTYILLHFGEDLRLVFRRTGDHKIPAHRFWFQVTWNIEKEVIQKRGLAFGH